MKPPVRCIALLLLLLVGSQDAAGKSLPEILAPKKDETQQREKRDTFDMVGFLERYGYLGPVSEGSETRTMGVFHSEVFLEEAIRTFQRFNQLPETGTLDAGTRAKMAAPRCGFPDIVQNTTDPRSPLPFTTMGTKWENNIVTWRANGLSRQLSHPSQIDAMARALDMWAEVTPLEFRQTSDKPDIDISFGRFEHGDGYGNAFDGRGGTLAHAFRPGSSSLSGDAHFDEDERWTLYGADGTDLFTVAAHEFGHSLGLGHSQEAGALMAPYYKGYNPNLRLHHDDIRGIQSLYGAKQKENTTPSTTTITTTTTPAPTPRPTQPTPNTPDPTPRPTDRPRCDIVFDAVTMGPDDFAYGFSGRMVYKMADSGVMPGYPRLSHDVFPEAPNHVGLAFHVPYSEHTYLMRGSRLWRYTGFELDRGYPRSVDTSNFPETPTAAVIYPSPYGKPMVLMFGRSSFWEWNSEEERRAWGPTLATAQFWRGLPSYIRGALAYKDGYLYFFQGNSYIKVHPNYRSSEPGYPRSVAPAWLGFPCGQTPK